MNPPSFKGKKHSLETKMKMSEIRKRIGSPWNIGRKHSAETKKKISEACMGIKFSDEHRKKLSEKKLGAGAPTWKGGITKLPEYVAYHSRQRRLRKLKASGSHTVFEWKALKESCAFTCLSCKRSEPEIKLTEDHIVPLSKGGTDDISNIQPLCLNCNQRKSAKTVRFEMALAT